MSRRQAGGVVLKGEQAPVETVVIYRYLLMEIYYCVYNLNSVNCKYFSCVYVLLRNPVVS